MSPERFPTKKKSCPRKIPMNKPIRLGMFDSGVGGLTVAHAIRQRLPQINMLYYGDTLHLPYGDKGPETLQTYSRTIGRYLLSRGADLLLIACNSASAYAYDAVRAIDPEKPTLDVIRPVVQHLGNTWPKGTIGVIGTRATIRSGIYTQLLQNQFPQIKVKALATPLLAPFAEEGIEDPQLRSAMVAHYLKQPALQEVDALVLACTHYPLLKKEIRAQLPEHTQIVDPAEILALELQNRLPALEGQSQMECLVSEWTPAFAQAAQLMFGENLEVKQHNIHPGT